MEYAEFNIQDLLPIGLILVVLGIALAYGLQVMGDVKDDVAEAECSNLATTTSYNESSGLCYEAANTSNTASPTSAEFNATEDSITGVAKMPDKLPTIVTVIVAAIIIGILIRYMTVR